MLATIWEASDGWKPSPALVSRLRSKARAKGLISDWPIVSALANHDLLLNCTHVTGTFGADLIATKRNGKWEFMSDGEYMSES